MGSGGFLASMRSASMNLPKDILDVVQSRSDSVRVFKSGPATQAVLASTMLAQGTDVVVIVPGAAELAGMAALLRLLAPPDAFAVFPPYPPRDADPAAWGRRWAALHGLASRRGPRGALLTLDNLLPRWPPRSVLEVHHLRLAKGDEMLVEAILEQAVAWGYERVRMVARPGEVAVRGDILDVYAPGLDLPVRMEFFGDVLEDMRLFDPATQRSKRDIKSFTLLPVAPAVTTPELVDAARERWSRHQRLGELTQAGRDHMERLLDDGGGRIPPGLYYEEPATLADWLPREAVRIVTGAQGLRTRLEEVQWSWRQWLDEQAGANGWRWPGAALLQNAEGARKAWLGNRQVVFEDLALGERGKGLDMPERTLHAFEDLFWQPEHKRRPWHTLVSALKDWSRERSQVVLSFRTERSRKKFLSLAEPDGIRPALEYAPDGKGLFALVSPLRKGFELQWGGALVLAEDVLQPGRAPSRADTGRDFVGLSAHDDLTEGDLLVHRDYGLARFAGLHRLNVGAAANDYLLLQYSGDDKLYLSVDRLNLVQRWKGPEGVQPALDRLGGTGWTRARDRARKAIETIARELVEMYAWRKIAKGYAYERVGDLFWEFEASFGFEETPDQAKAISEVLADMERPEPMDRLVCGDVGFGKTEVALRAAFRAALDGRQVALVCPTTVLAEQHYQTFLQRLEPYPVTVGMLSRFVPKPRQKAVLEAVARGQVDILIGTHRLLSKDVDLPNLGLLILDEEQRFGVRHKERLKEMRKNVDALALTATPIPRTLQLSLSGIRSLSVIETPPLDRKPVHTALIERDDDVLRQVLSRELERQGQVFWVHNRVKGLEAVAERVRALAPDARVGMAHGRMAATRLEDEVRRFWRGETDILVCTAIIESGLDFPRANTLIVDQAQLFGLGQLYQLRGRVGRSDRQAYAYFMIHSLKGLSEISRRRLQVILDMDYLGAGFRVAMEDLRLRGAGNILGEAQSGSIAKVGLDLYLEMLEEEVRRLKGESLTQDTDPELSIHFEANLPQEYITDSRDRMRYYKALSSARDTAALDELRGEIRDRFGPLPVEAERFVAVIGFKRLLAALQVSRAELYPNRAVLHWAEGATAVQPQRLVDWVQERPGRARMVPPGGLELRIPEKMSIRQGVPWMETQLAGLPGDEESHVA